MGAALAPTELFVVKPGTGMEGLSLTGGNGGNDIPGHGVLLLQHNGSVGLVCDDAFDDIAAQVACRDLGMAGGVAFSEDVQSGTMLADNVKCFGTEVSLRECSFRGWQLHDCTPREAAGPRSPQGFGGARRAFLRMSQTIN